MTRPLTDEERADVEDVLPLLWQLARRAARSGQGAEDLFGAGLDGYLAGVLTADPARGPRRPFALRRASGAILDTLRRARRELVVPSDAFDESTEGSEVGDSEAWAALRRRAREQLGLEAWGQLHRLFALDPVAAREVPPLEAVRRAREQALSALPPRDQELLRWRWEEELDGAAIGARLGKSRSQANRMLAAAFGRFEEQTVALARHRLGLAPGPRAQVVPLRPKPRETS